MSSFGFAINYGSIIFTMFLIILVVWLLNEITRYHGKKALTTKELIVFYISFVPIILEIIIWRSLPNLNHCLGIKLFHLRRYQWTILSPLVQLVSFTLVGITMCKMTKTVKSSKKLKSYILFALTCTFFLLHLFFVNVYQGSLLWVVFILYVAPCAFISTFYILVCRARTNYNRQEEKAKRREYREKKREMRKDSPNLVRAIEKFHRYPWLNVVINAIALALFVTPLKSGNMTEFIIFFGLGCILLIIIQSKLPRSLRKETAMMFMEKCKKEGDNSLDPYFYMHRYEVKHFGWGKWHKEDAFPMFIGDVLFVINYVFYILSALLAVVLAGIVAVGGAMIFFVHLVCKATAMNGFSSICLNLAKLAFMPLKLAFVFLATVYPFKWVLAPFRKNHVPHSSPRVKGGVSAYESDLHIQKYMRVNYSLPYGAHWERDTLECYGANVHFTGTIVADSDSFDYPRYVNLLNDAERDIKNILEGQVQDFMRDYPNARGAKVTVRIDGELR